MRFIGIAFALAASLVAASHCQAAQLLSPQEMQAVRGAACPDTFCLCNHQDTGCCDEELTCSQIQVLPPIYLKKYNRSTTVCGFYWLGGGPCFNQTGCKCCVLEYYSDPTCTQRTQDPTQYGAATRCYCFWP